MTDLAVHVWKLNDPRLRYDVRTGDRAAIVALAGLQEIGKRMTAADRSRLPTCICCDYQFRGRRIPVGIAAFTRDGADVGIAAPLCSDHANAYGHRLIDALDGATVQQVVHIRLAAPTDQVSNTG